MRFIGDVDHQTANEVADSLDRLLNSMRFDVRLTHLGSFGGHKPRALYAGLEPSDALSRLQAAQERVLQRAGLAPEGRKFVPHVTLARLPSANALDVVRFMSGSQLADSYYNSNKDLVGGGPYIVEQSYSLPA
ncbi:MAG: RNA 2',3'-cyclic phosphodiesterase [Candidatus Devosia symbiotica]|nr:RNA 2',3'-cyclic phosphodiesterase [Candidatus Devosia symbiotica]